MTMESVRVAFVKAAQWRSLNEALESESLYGPQFGVPKLNQKMHVQDTTGPPIPSPPPSTSLSQLLSLLEAWANASTRRICTGSTKL